MLRHWLQVVKKRLGSSKIREGRKEARFNGYEAKRQEIKYVDILSDTELRQVNNMLQWNSFTIDRRGRRFGNAAWEGKRDKPELIPDGRVLLLHEKFDLSDKRVLEIGCFEGIHTVALSGYAQQVTAVDVRIENVVKTIVRCAFFGYHPTVFRCNIEEPPLQIDWLRCDVVFHVGVLYHLKNPVAHLSHLAEYVRRGVLLDTHYALDAEATEQYELGGRIFRYKKYREGGYADPFSGVYDHAKWLRLDDITALLRRVGFATLAVVETREERNGPRVLLIATRA